MNLGKRLLLIPPVALGIGIVALMSRTRDAPVRTNLEERARVVVVRTLAPTEVVPRAVGYGTAQPGRTWRAFAEVSGRVVAVNPLLNRGEILPEGAELLRIDATDYELAVARLEAEIASYEAELEWLDVDVENAEALLEVALETVKIAQRELERLKKLGEQGNVSSSAVDTQEQAVLRDRTSVVDLENNLRTLPVQRRRLEATRDAKVAQLGEALRDLVRTTVVAPFPCRIASVEVEAAQFVTVGSQMLEADSIDVAEVPAQLALERVRHLLRVEDRVQALANLDSEEVWESFGLEATVRLQGTGFAFEWPARFARAIGLDPKTRTVGFVAAVDQNYVNSSPGGRPPLVKEMFVEVEFRGAPLPDRLVVPISAVHQGRVYLVDDDSRLEIRPIEIDFVQLDDAVLASGLEAGDRVVLTDLIPAIPGMLLKPLTEAP